MKKWVVLTPGGRAMWSDEAPRYAVWHHDAWLGDLEDVPDGLQLRFREALEQRLPEKRIMEYAFMPDSDPEPKPIIPSAVPVARKRGRPKGSKTKRGHHG